DFVNLDGLSTNINIGLELAESKTAGRSAQFPGVASMWDPNREDGSTNNAVPTVGIRNQIHGSMHIGPRLSTYEWTDFNRALGQDTKARQAGIDNFRKFMGI